METLFQNAKVPYLSSVRAFIFLPIFTHPDSYRDYIYPGFNFLHFACGRLPKGTIEKRREEKRSLSFLSLDFQGFPTPLNYLHLQMCIYQNQLY